MRHRQSCGQGNPSLGKGKQKSFDLIGELVAHLIGSMSFPECCEEGIQQEFDKSGGIPCPAAVTQDAVVVCLAITNHSFDREPGKQGVPLGEDEDLPKTADPAIAIAERVDKLELIMENRAGDERVGIGTRERSVDRTQAVGTPEPGDGVEFRVGRIEAAGSAAIRSGEGFQIPVVGHGPVDLVALLDIGVGFEATPENEDRFALGVLAWDKI